MLRAAGWAAVVASAACGRGFFDPERPCDGAVAEPGAPVFVQSTLATSSSNAVPFLETALPLPQQAGDLLVVAVGFDGTTASISGIADSQGNTYAAGVGPTLAMGWAQLAFIGRVLEGANAIRVTASVDTRMRVVILEYAGVDEAAPLDGTSMLTGGSSSTVAAAPLTTTNARDTLVALASSDFRIAGQLPDFTQRVSSDDQIGQDRTVDAAGTYDATSAPGTNGNWVMHVLALRGH